MCGADGAVYGVSGIVIRFTETLCKDVAQGDYENKGIERGEWSIVRCVKTLEGYGVEIDAEALLQNSPRLLLTSLPPTFEHPGKHM
jgi:hypothetical protein